MKHAKLPAVMNLSGGKFSATPAKFTVSNAKVNLLDAALTVDGSLESPDRAPLSLDATATGTIGAQMTEWISRQIDWPKQLTLRSPLQLTKGRMLWKKDGDVAFTGTSPLPAVREFHSTWFGRLKLFRSKSCWLWTAVKVLA